MRKPMIGCAIAGLMALSPKPVAMPHRYVGALATTLKVLKGQVGIASWYGDDRQGMPTASGELFDGKERTAAHPALPFGTTVRVTNLDNSQSTLLRINDRGPGVCGRLIDVSWAVAKDLGFVEEGLARVEIDVVSCPTACGEDENNSSTGLNVGG